MSWEETKKLSKHVREHGIEQFINLYRRLKDRTGDVLKWGDEVGFNQLVLLVCVCAHNVLLFTRNEIFKSIFGHAYAHSFTVIGILLMDIFDLNGRI